MSIENFNQKYKTFNQEIVTQLTTLQTNIDAKLTATQGAVVADIAASTNIDAVPVSFADLAAVQSYLAGANMVPNIESRLDGAEAKINALLAALRAANIIDT